MIKQDNSKPTRITTIKETNFFVFLIKICKQKQSKETKQNNNKVKRLEVRDSPCRNPLVPRQWRQKKS
jgi:hypothetical protein